MSSFRRSSWLGMHSAPLVLCAFVVTAAAQNPGGATNAQPRHEIPPYWAYAINPPEDSPESNRKAVANNPRHVPGSDVAFTVEQTNDFFSVPDWHPIAHPALPEIVAHGRKPEVFACGYCHLPNGQGRPENSSLAGLPAEYIVQQMADFKSGLRKSSDPRHLPVATMIAYETKANDAEIQAAAKYFSELKPKLWIRVVETRTVPKTHVAGWMLVVSASSGREPIGQRIIETPEYVERTELRDDASGFIAYVPVGAIKKGKSLATTGGSGKTVPCAACHGPDFRGLKNVPSIAGRSPSYVVRQLYDMQNGSRAGTAAQLMKPVVAKLTMDDMVSIAAYTASLRP